MVRPVNCLLAFSKVFVVTMLVVEMLRKSSGCTADFLASGNVAGPTRHRGWGGVGKYKTGRAK